MVDINPIKQVFDGLWTVLEAHTGFTALVAVGNRIKFTKGVSGKALSVTTRTPLKPRIFDGDFPQVRIVPQGGFSHGEYSSSGSLIEKTFHIEALTAEQQYDDLGELEWEIFRAFADWRTATVESSTVLAAMTWTSLTFVTDVSLKATQQSLATEKGIVGWKTLWAATVRMDFSTTTL